MNVRLIAVLGLLLAPLLSYAAMLGNIGSNTSFVANSSFSAIQNLGNGSFANGERVTGVDIRIGTKAGSLFNSRVRSFISDSSGAGSFNTPGYIPTVEGEHVYHFDLLTPFVPDPLKCYTLTFFQFFDAPTTATTTFYGWNTNQYTASTTGCHSTYASHNINTALQNPALNGHGMVDYSFQIYTEPVTPPQSPPTISNLKQYRQFGVEEIAEGATFVGNAAVFKVDVTDADSAQVKLELEIKPEGTPFDGTNIIESDMSAPGSVSIEHNELIPVAEHYVAGGNVKSFHWRVRAVDAEGNASDWTAFDQDNSAGPDFTAKVVPLYTQRDSEFPSEEQTRAWFTQNLGQGNYSDCLDRGLAEEPPRSTIRRCGCAITSMVMIGRYHDITTGVDNTDVNPLRINTWLSLNEGYGEKGKDTGDIVWDKGIEYLSFDDVDGVRKTSLAIKDEDYNTTDMNRIEAALDAGLPVIAYDKVFASRFSNNPDTLVGHYFVLGSEVKKTEHLSTLTVRDPLWYETQTLDDSYVDGAFVQQYGGDVMRANIFRLHATPQPLALTTALFKLASPAELLVTDSLGRRVGKDPRTNTEYAEIPYARYVLEGTVTSIDEPIAEPHDIKVVRFTQLPPDEYHIQVIGTGEGSYTLTTIIMERDATYIATSSEVTQVDDVTNYTLKVEEGTEPELHLTFDELVSKLQSLIQQSSLNPQDRFGLLDRVQAIMSAYSSGDIALALEQITKFEKRVQQLIEKRKISSSLAGSISVILEQMRKMLL